MSDKLELIVPTLGESVSEAVIARWAKASGDSVQQDELLLELETDKVTLEVNAPKAGVLTDIKVQQGDTVKVGDVLAFISADDGDINSSKSQNQPVVDETLKTIMSHKGDEENSQSQDVVEEKQKQKTSPAAQKLMQDHKAQASAIPATGKDGRITKQDVLEFLKSDQATPQSIPQSIAQSPAMLTDTTTMDPANKSRLERVPMSKLRQTIARRLKDAQNNAAMLTTFNEVDMSNVIALRARMKDSFERKHGVKLGFMSFFLKAVVQALKEIPAVNAEIDGNDLIYKNFYDIGVAVGAPKGLMVPVIRDADKLSFAGIEQEILNKATKAREGSLSIDEMSGGTFTITNGGIYGSMMSTPILNAPQSGILGMHNIIKRPIAVDDEIKIRPMMYLALSYDHRVVDGKEAVTFLVRIKESIEDPERLLLDI